MILLEIARVMIGISLFWQAYLYTLPTYLSQKGYPR